MVKSRAETTKRTHFRLATWNIKKSLKTTTPKNSIVNTLSNYEIDIACLQETGVTEEQIDKIGKYKIIYSGESRADMREFQGVGVAFKIELEKQLERIKLSPEIAERIMYFTLKTNLGIVHIINIYSPTEKKESLENDTFYENVEKIFLKVPESEHVFVLGDFNAHVGAEKKTLTTCIGPYGYGRANCNGHRLLRFCSKHKLCITNTYFDKDINKRVTYYSRSHKSWHQLDLILTRYRDYTCINEFETCIYLEHTDHCMVTCQVKLSQKHESNVNTSIKEKTQNNEKDCHKISHLIKFILCKHLQQKPKPDRDIKFNWIELKKCISKLYPIKCLQIRAFKVFRKTFSNRVTSLKLDLMKSSKKEIWNIVSEKKKAVENVVTVFLAETQCSSNEKRQILEELRNLIEELEKDFIIKKKKTELKVFKWNWRRLEKLPSIADANKGIEMTKNRKELNGISETRKRQIFEFFHKKKQSLLHSFLAACWKSGHVPLKMCFAKMHCSSSNYNLEVASHEAFSGINVVSVIFSAISCVIAERLKSVVLSNKCSLYQFDCGKKMMASREKVQDIFRKKNKPLFLARVDLSKVLENMNRNFLLNFLLRVGCPSTLVNLIAHFIELNDNATYLTRVLYDIFFQYIFYIHLQKKDDPNICLQYLCLNVFHCSMKAEILSNSINKREQCLDNMKQRLQSFDLTTGKIVRIKPKNMLVL